MPACDHARHFARAGQLGAGADALRALARANGISEEKARALQAEALKIWRKRSRLAWTVRVDQTLLDGYQRSPGFRRPAVHPGSLPALQGERLLPAYLAGCATVDRLLGGRRRPQLTGRGAHEPCLRQRQGVRPDALELSK